jgi:PKHD-type hydroxylase
MMLQVPQLFSKEEVGEIRRLLETAAWDDGRLTAGHIAQSAKNNLQLKPGELSEKLASTILDRLGKSPLFISAVLPKTVYTPRINRYEGGGTYGNHVDNAFQTFAGTAQRVRTDVSTTLFLSEPEEYEGGELVVEDTYGVQGIKLPAGSLIIYPGTSVHRVNPVTKGARTAAFFWSQSLVRDDAKRRLLFELDQSIQSLTQQGNAPDEVVRLSGIYHNLLRQWAEN